MRVYKKRFMLYTDTWHIFPTLALYIDVPYYPFRNIEIQFHVLCFHWAIIFEREGAER